MVRILCFTFSLSRTYLYTLNSKFAPDDLVSRIRTYGSLEAPNPRTRRGFYVGKAIHSHMDEDDLVYLSNRQESGWLDEAILEFLRWILPGKLMIV